MDLKVPEQIETERLLLRQFRDDDWVALHKYYSDSVATEFTTGKKYSEPESWRVVAMMLGHWKIRGFGPYAVEEKESACIVGTVGFWYPLEWPEPEIKWALLRSHWGRGFAREAAAAVLQVGSEQMPNIQLISLIHKNNAPSISVARAIGAKYEKDLSFRQQPHAIYRHKKAL